MKILELLGKYKITPNPDAGQHFMVDEKALRSVVSAAEIKPSDVVLEIGAGIGNLTRLLAKKAKKVYAIEKDERFTPILEKELSEFDNVELIISDALKIDFHRFNKLVANLPYQICEALLQKLIGINFKSAVVCVPETFAKIVCAKEGERDFSKLSIIAQIFFDAKRIKEIKKESFYPEPRTKSVLLRLAPKKPVHFHDYFFQELLRQHDRKLKNALREALISASKNTNREFGTKRSAKNLISRWNLPDYFLNKKVAELRINELKEIKRAPMD